MSDTYYHPSTPTEVRRILEWSRETRERITIVYGHTDTGVPWGDPPIHCHIGRSTGNQRVPLTIKTRRCFGGEAVLDHCIVMIRQGAKVLYKVQP